MIGAALLVACGCLVVFVAWKAITYDEAISDCSIRAPADTNVFGAELRGLTWVCVYTLVDGRVVERELP
jgi:hypothetical protein